MNNSRSLDVLCRRYDGRNNWHTDAFTNFFENGGITEDDRHLFCGSIPFSFVEESNAEFGSNARWITHRNGKPGLVVTVCCHDDTGWFC